MIQIIGLFVLLGELLNSSVISILFRWKSQNEDRKFGVVCEFTETIRVVSMYFEYAGRLLTVFISILQFAITHSTDVEYCTSQLGVLELEAYWLNIIACIQISKVILLTSWQFKSSDWCEDKKNSEAD